MIFLNAQYDLAIFFAVNKDVIKENQDEVSQIFCKDFIH